MSLAYQLAEDHPGTLVDMRRIDLPKSFPGHGLIRDDDIHDLERGGEQLAVVHLGTEVGLPLKERLARGHDRKHVAALYRPVGIGGHDMAAPPDGVDEGGGPRLPPGLLAGRGEPAPAPPMQRTLSRAERPPGRRAAPPLVGPPPPPPS